MRNVLQSDSFSGKLRRVKFLARLGPRHGTAIAAGVLLALSFPRTDVAGLAWLAPGLMLFAGLGARDKQSFHIGYLAGLAHYLCSLPVPPESVAHGRDSALKRITKRRIMG